MLPQSSYDVTGYQAFRERARDSTLSGNEMSGFPDEYRLGQSDAIFGDICSKLIALRLTGAKVLDIGAGCGDLARHIIDECGRKQQRLTIVDSPEVYGLLPDEPHVIKVEGPFPGCLPDLAACGSFDAILAYSVCQYVFAEANFFAFVDAAAGLLSDGGELLLGDIPNASMRKRFLASGAGEKYHREHYAPLPMPEPAFNQPNSGQIDDGVILGLLSRMRSAGFHAFVVPQAGDLPMANRREDILIRRP